MHLTPNTQLLAVTDSIRSDRFSDFWVTDFRNYVVIDVRMINGTNCLTWFPQYRGVSMFEEMANPRTDCGQCWLISVVD